MLEYVANIFKIIIKFINILYTSSLIVGKFVLQAAIQIGQIIYIIVLTTVNCAIIIHEELTNFLYDVCGNTTEVVNNMGKGLVNTVNSLARIGEITISEIVRFFTTGQMQIKTLIEAVYIFLECLIINARGALVLIGDISWGFIVAAPKLLIVSTILLYHLVGELTNSIFIILEKMTLSIYNVPKHSILGLVAVFLLVIYKRRVYASISRLYLTMSQNVAGRYRRFRHSSRQQQVFNTTGVPVVRPQDTSESDENPNRNPIDDNLCIVCQEHVKCVVLLPCRHLCMCVECSENIEFYQKSCPLCRIYIRNKMTVYI